MCFVGFFCLIEFVVYMDEKDKPTIPIEALVINIDQVSEHSPEHYSVKYTLPNGHLDEIYLGTDADLIPDIPEDQPMWAQIERAKSENGDIFYMSGVVHIHSAADINGAGYRKRVGKHWVQEQTVVVDAE
jgi:hypothetical protein